MKRVLIIGASGALGSSIVQELRSDTEIITAGSSSGDYQVDLGDSSSIQKLLKDVGELDAIISTPGRGVVFKSVQEITKGDFSNSFQVKLLGQIDLVLQGAKYLRPGGSITLTTGILSEDFIAGGSAAATVNAAVNTFAQSASLELPNGVRVNVVSPALLEESVDVYKDFFQGYEPIPAAKAARAFRKSVYGIQTGKIYKVL